ncbi:response regulator [Paenibacillus sp. CN-4]|uniref:response regulator n=1 Tax=Paenibacillus nanchangensis TaxID=3348343 RepID=UPI00397A5720
MYRVLIVDDELAIREGLASLLDWESLGYEVVDTAANAIEAEHKFRLYAPDLMIVDIRMPGKSGLELIQTLRELDPELQIIILSGYADFGYARQALTFGVGSYLLKPVDEDELQLYLTNLTEELNARSSQRKNQAAVKGWSREMLIQSLLMESSSQAAPHSEISIAEAELSWDAYQIVLIRLLNQDQAESGPSTAVKTKLSAQFDEQGWGIVFSLDSYLGVLLRPSYQKEWVRKVMAETIKTAASGHGMDCLITAGDMVDTLEDIAASYQSALTRMKEHFFYDEQGMISPDSLKLKRGNPVNSEEVERRLEAAAERLYFVMDTGGSGLIASLVQECGELMTAAGYSELAVKSRYARMVTFLLNKLSLQHKELDWQPSQMEAEIQLIYSHSSLSHLQRYLTSLLEQYAKAMAHDEMEILIKRMTDLIHRQYKENLKLETLAEVFTYSSAYLGKLFKNSTGYSFNSYLDKVRMEKAKALLDQGKKIHQAAAEAGFSDVDYFREKFKKAEGLSPSEYRRQKTSRR